MFSNGVLYINPVVLAGQQRLVYISSERTLDTVKKTKRNYDTHTHTHTHIYIYIYICVCVCVCVIMYIYILSSTDRLYRGITNPQCGQTRRTLQARIEIPPNISLNIVSYLPNPSARAGYDTRSIFKRSLTGLNSEFSFS